MWQPRFGLTWDPSRTGRTVVRVGAGLFNARTPLLLLNQAFNSNGNPEVGVGFTLSAAQIRQVRAARPEFVFPFVPDPSSAANSAFITGAGVSGVNPDASFFAPNFRNPRALQYTAAVEQELTRNFAAGVEYVHVNTTRLERIRDVNLGPPVPDTTGRNIYSNPRPNTRFNILRQQESSARANYDGLSLSLRGRQMRGLSFLGSYTLAYNRDTDSNERNFAGTTYEDVNNLRREYRWSRVDIRHRLVASGVYDLPFKTARYGIQLGSIVRYESGTPFSAFTGADTNRDGQFTDRPIVNGVPLLRNSFRQPNFFVQDLRVTQIFRVKERHRFDLVVECFNLWNKKNFLYTANSNETSGAAGNNWGDGPTPRINQTFRVTQFRNRNLINPLPDPSTGSITGNSLNLSRGAIVARSPFEVQFALKYTF